MGKQLPDPPFTSAGNSDLSSIICRETVRCSVMQCVEGMRAIILTGSMARGEGTYFTVDGGVRVMGDAEFVLIFRDQSSIPSAERISGIRNDIEGSLAAVGISCVVGLSAVLPSFLSESLPHVFAYELRVCGKVIWGEPEILQLMPAFRPSDVPLEDAWRLLQNRMVEMLQLPDDFGGNRTALTPEMHYRTVKLVLDMATSFLLFAGSYAPTFQQRLVRMRELVSGKSKEDWPFPLESFAQEVECCTHWKLGRKIEQSSPEVIFWVKAVAYAQQLWRWELARLSGASRESCDRDLFTAWMRKQPYKQRLRGWLFVLRHQGWLGSWRQWPRWARRAWQASPRYWIYLAASEFLFVLAVALQSGVAEDSSRFIGVLDYLPLRRDIRGKPGWLEIAREISFNYYQLLVETRV
jgi:hypothetical protein